MKISPIRTLPSEDRESLQTTVSNEVRAHLARRRVSARQVSEMLGWTQNYFSRRLRGVYPFNVSDLEALAQLLDVPVTAFFATAPATEPRGHGNIADITGR